MDAIGPEALGRLFDAHAPALRLYARQWCAGADADDAVQEAFISLARQPAMPVQVMKRRSRPSRPGWRSAGM